MFSSKFLSGANPLNAVSSAVNKLGLFGDDGEGHENTKAPSQQGAKPPGEQQTGAGPGKGPQQQPGPQKSGQGPPMQKSSAPPEQGSPQLHGNRQTGPPNKPDGKQALPTAGKQPESQHKGEPQKIQPQGSPKSGAQQQSLTKGGAQPESPKASTPKQVIQKQGPPKTGAQRQESAKTRGQESPKDWPQKAGSQQGSPKVGQQQQGSSKPVQPQGSSKVGQQQQGVRTTPQQASDKPGDLQRQGPRGPGTPGLTLAGSSSQGATKAGSQPRAVAKPRCPVCKTEELNMNTKEPPNYKTCSQCKSEVCSMCGFSPPDSDGREWLCLTCQLQRAQGSSGPSVKMPIPNKVSATQNRTPSPAAPVSKEMSAPVSPQKTLSTSSKVPAKGELAREAESQKQATPKSVRKSTPETQRKSGSQKPDQTSQTARKQSTATPAPQQGSGSLFGFGGSKSETAKPEESVTGKMFGFGSSIFSSASTLIASAVQDETKTTPPVSPKSQSTKESKPPAVQTSVHDKKQEKPQQTKAHPAGQAKEDKTPSETSMAAAASCNIPKAGQLTCPLCKTVLNMGSKDPPNYNTCTECKSTVCNQCGFNPMPNVKEGKEWLCLNCQVKRATGGIEPKKDTSLVNSAVNGTTPAQPAPLKTSASVSPQRKLTTPAAQPDKVETGCKQESPATGQKTPQQSRKMGSQSKPDQTTQTTQKQGQKPAAKQEESGGLFGFGSPKRQTDPAKPAESVTGKMFGFGSSIFSSASTLINSSVHEEPKTTPPVSSKMPAAKDSQSATAKQQEQEKKPEQPKQTKGLPSTYRKADQPTSELPQKAPASPVISKADQSTCPLCKLQLNVGSKDPPNYNTCTVCKINACNQCGFNPIPNVKEVKEWVCLNCQMQRALGASEPPGTPMIKPQASPNKVTTPADVLKNEKSQMDKPGKKDIPTTAESKIKETAAPGSPQRKPPTPAEQPVKAGAVKRPENQKDLSKTPHQNTPHESQRTNPQKPTDQTNQTGPKQSNTTSTRLEESGGFFGHGPKTQSDFAKPAESVGGKVFGFGSSIFSSASTLINSAVQDDSKTVSPKMTAAKVTKSPLSQKEDQEKKREQVQQPKSSPLLQTKIEVALSEPPKDAAASPAAPKAGQSTCPLCKVELNFGSKEPPNYNSCTGCKITVCNQCGFKPMTNVSEVKQWLCLNCQMQRALSSSELTAPPTKPQHAANNISPSAVHQKIIATEDKNRKGELSKSDTPPKVDTPAADALNKKGSYTPGSPQKTAVTQPTKVAKGPQVTQASPTPGKKTPLDIMGDSGSQKPANQTSQPEVKEIKVTKDTQQGSGNLFGLSGPKTSPGASKTTESMTGKMFGFGSSIFSSASTLISSAVQEESHTTPPGSRKMSAPAQVSPKMSAVPKVSPKSTPTVSPKMSPARESKTLTQKPEQKKKSEESYPSKEDNVPSQSAKAATRRPNAGEATCPLCKVELNIGSKDAPNYNTCTECKTTVCTQCGFNPMPMGEVKEWLCLNCQMKRAVGASEPLGLPSVVPQKSPSTSPSKAPLLSSKPPTHQKDSLGPDVHKKDTPEPVSPQRKLLTQSLQSGKPEAAPKKQASPVHGHKTPQERQEKGPKEQPNQSDSTAAIQQDSGGFFGFGGPKPQPDAAKSTVTGKMFGFGSSIFSSASSLMTSAIQDQPKTTPPASPKMSPKKEIKHPGAQSVEQQKKSEPSRQNKTPQSGQAKLDQAQPELRNPAAASQVDVKPGQSTCPLCKVEFNLNAMDLPNYNTCTACKNTVCNQCGFNTMTNETGMKEWLCLSCQMQRATAVKESSGVTSLSSQTPQKTQEKSIKCPAETEKKESSVPHSPQRKLSVTAQAVTTEGANKPVPSQKKPQEPQKTSGLNKPPDQIRQTERKQSNATTVTPQESAGLFGFGGGKAQPAAAKPAESVTGKMFGFGSSIFGSASALITSAVQDQPKTTPPVSPKMSPAKEMKSPATQKKDQQILERPQQTKTPSLTQAKLEKAPSEPPKSTEVIQVSPKGQSTCPLCKVKLNVGSKDPPNYNTCTGCKNTVCNQCGFNPMPNVSEMKTWLCLTCQMQKALTESVEPPLVKPKASPNKVFTPAAAANQKKDIISTQKADVPDKKQDSPTANVPHSKEETSLHKTQTPAIKTVEISGSPPTKEVPTSTKEMAAVVSNLKNPLPVKTSPVNTDIKEKEITTLSSPATKEVSERKEKKAGIVQKSADQPVTSLDEVKPKQAQNKESNPVQTSPAKSSPPAAQPSNQESGGSPSIGSPKLQHATSKTTEAVTGKVLGFGSSLFSSASTLITSAVQESRTTPPSSRKMSSPAQVSDKMSASQIPPKSSPPVSLKTTSAKEAKLPVAEKPNVEQIQDKPQQAKAPSPGQAELDRGPSEPVKPEASQAALKVGQSICPLCRAELNMGSKDPPNYNVCTECKTTVCNKCGFSPMPNVKEEWLCLNCQMQRALGASEPPGLPMMKSQSSPNKEVPATKQKQEPPISTSQEDIPKTGLPKDVLVNVPTTNKPEYTALGSPTKKVSPSPASLSDKPVPFTVSKNEMSPASQKFSIETPKETPDSPQQPPKSVSSIDTTAPPPDEETRKQDNLKAVTSISKSAPPPDREAENQEPPRAVTSITKSAPLSSTEPGKATPQERPKPVTSISKSVPTPDREVVKTSPQPSPKAGASPAKSVPPPVQPAKQESGGFFGFGGPKTQPNAASSAGSVTGKMFGFGSSFLSSASNLITSSVQDEPKTTPPTPRKMSTTAHVTPKNTPPASPAKDAKPPAVQKTGENKPQQKNMSTAQAKENQVPSEFLKTPTGTQDAPKADLSICPLCKVELNMGYKDPPNYNTCTKCKTTVCNQCGFNPLTNVSEVKEWLCLNCQMQRSPGASEPTGRPAVKPLPSPSKVSTHLGSDRKDTPTLAQNEKSADSSVFKKDNAQQKGEAPKVEDVLPSVVRKTPTPRESSMEKTQGPSGTEQRQGQGVTGQQLPTGKSPQVQLSQTPKPEVKTGLSKQEPEKLPQQPSKSTTSAVKSVPQQAQPAKKESGGFFGFGSPKSQPAGPKSAESVTGKMFGFGSSIFSSASTLITSAVQDEPKTTPPTPRKMSTTAHVSPKATPPVSPNMSPAKETKPPSAQKSKLPQEAKPASSPPDKVEKAPSEPPKSTEVTQVSPKGPSTCPLCKVELNMGSKDPPNYNTCTQCKSTVCSLCGFNPTPHTGTKEWLCLSCQTQRALLGQLGDSGKIPQPSPASAKRETQAPVATKKAEPKTTPTKEEPIPAATESQPTPAAAKAVPTVQIPKVNMEPLAVKMETTASAAPAQIQLETTLKPTTAKVLPATTEKQPLAATSESIIPTMAPGQDKLTPKVDVPNTDVPKTVTLGGKEEAGKTEFNVTEHLKMEDPKPGLSKVKVDVGGTVASSSSVTTVVPDPPDAAEVDLDGVVPMTETQPEVSAPQKTFKEEQLDDHINLTDPTKSLQQVEVEPEPHPVLGAEPVVIAGSKEVADKLAEKIIEITSSPEIQSISTKNITMKEQDETKREPMKERKASLSTGKDQMGNVVVPVAAKTKSEAEGDDGNQPQILTISQEVEEGLVRSDTSKNNIGTYPSMPKEKEEEEGEAERGHLSFQAMEESSESELTPPPSPNIQRRRLTVSNVSSSSEDIKTESAESYVEDEDFIRKQIMGMGDEEEMSLSEDEKEEKLANEDAIKEAELDNATETSKPLVRKSSTEKDDSPSQKKVLLKAGTATSEDVAQTLPNMTFKKAIPVMRQRQSTDEEVESITESLSKGSSSVQASTCTAGSSPTSASSLEEDSDSSPSHRKVSGDKQHRKGKHRQPPQPLPTIEDSSEDEKMSEEKSRKHKEELLSHSKPLSPTEDVSSTEDLRQEETSRTSGSEYSASMDSEPEARRAVQRGRKPSPTVIPYLSSDPFKEKDTVAKSLKSAEEAYEEIIQRTKAIPGESPPDIEPLYGGMAIEDYLYESLVEEPEIMMSDLKDEDVKQDAGSESIKKLRSPEEVYEEMMQKKRELMMIEEEFQQAQTAMESSSSGASDTGPPSFAETCVVTIPTDETSTTGQIHIPNTGTETSSDVPVKKKKRPAPPRPSEPPKRTEVTIIPSTPTGSISFVRPMLPQNPALSKALFPIPDLKITQCSSGEEEDDSLAEEYGVGVSSDITTSDDSETKEYPPISPPLSVTVEMEPISVVCEIQEPKPLPNPISASELTTTPSPISPESPPTSPGTPDFSLSSNNTSPSSYQAQTPLSPDSTSLSTPTPPEILPTSPATTYAPTFNGAPVSHHTPSTVVVTIPDVVWDQSKDQTTDFVHIKTSTAETSTSAPAEMYAPLPVVVRMPDLVSSPSQVPIEAPAVTQVSALSPAPVIVSAGTAALVAAAPVTVSTPACVVSTSAVASSPGPVIVQMPDLVSTTSPICSQAPLPVLALVTTPTQPQAKVVHSVPVQPAIPYKSPVVVQTSPQTSQMSVTAPATTTIVKKKVPPPPPPRFTPVSLPEPNTELQLVKPVPTVTPTIAMGTKVTDQPMQSVVVDIQPRMEEIPDKVAVPQVVAPTRPGHVVIIVPSVENIQTLHGHVPQDIASRGPISSTTSLPQTRNIITHPVSNIPSTVTASLSTDVSTMPVISGPPLPPKPVPGTKGIDTVEIPVSDTPPPPPATLPKPTIHPKPQVPAAMTIATSTVVTQVVSTIGPSQTAKPPPPIPPKPISIPAGLVFSHKPGESVKPPPPVVPKAATLPRTKEPPNALSLSLSRPVESKYGASSPKSPLSPRHAKCLQTYVVITLPSELGSPTEGITVQAPVRRGSIPSIKVSEVRTTTSEQKTPTEAFSAQATVRRASVPTVRHPPSITIAPTVAGEQVTTSEIVVANVQDRRDSVPSVVQPPPSVVSSGQDVSIEVHAVPLPIKKPYVQQQPITQPMEPPKTMPEDITMATEANIHIQPLTVQATARAQSLPSDAQSPSIATEVISVQSEVSAETLVPQAPIPTLPMQPQPMIDAVAVSMQPELPLDAPVLQDEPALVPSTVIYPHVATQIKMPHKEQDMPTDVIVTEAVTLRSQMPGVIQQIPVQKQLVEGFKNTELPSVPQTVQPAEVQPLVTEQLSTQQPLLVNQGVTIPTMSELPTEVIATECAVIIPPESPVTQHLPIAADVCQTPVAANLMPLTTVAKMEISTVGAVTPSPLMMDVQQMAAQPEVPQVDDIPQVCGAMKYSVMSHSTPPLEVIALKPEDETPRETITKDVGREASISFSVMQHQTVTGMPVEIITTEETTRKKRTSISSTVQPPRTTNEMFTYPTEYEASTQVVTTEAIATTRRESITLQQPVLMAQTANMPPERDVPTDDHAVQIHYRIGSIPSTEQRPQVITYSSEYDHPLEIITTEAYNGRTSVPTAQDIPQGVSVAPVTITQIQQESIESQKIRGQEKVVSSMSHMYSSSISTSVQPPESLPSLVTQFVTTEVQRTTVSVVHERVPQVSPPSVAITIQPDVAKVQPLPKQNGKIVCPGDVIDLRTMKSGVNVTEKGMDLTPPESVRQSSSSDSSGRQITAVQPEIVNLSAEITPATTLTVVSDNITIVTCTATIASYVNTPAEKPLNLQGPVTSLPLPLTTYKPYEPLAQIVYRPVNSQATISAAASTAEDIPINLSFVVSSGGKQSTTLSPKAISDGGPILSSETTGAIDLSNYRPVRAMVAWSGTNRGVVTTVVDDDGTPVDLTAGRRSICCDVIYKLPFTGSCRTQPPITTQPDRGDDHYQYDNAGLCGIKGMNGIKASISETHLTETGIFSYDPKNDHDRGSSDGAIDLTAAKLSAGIALDYTSKATGGYPGMTTAPYSQVPSTGYGVNSVLRASHGVVYSSVAAPVPSTYAITTQPGSVLSTTYTPISTVQNQSLPLPYGLIPSADPGLIIPYDTGLPKELLPTAFADIITGYPDMYSDTTLEAIAASLDALASSPIFPGLDNTKMAQYQMEREFLELEKLKQLCLAEELEWERQEIQRYREHEQLMVQRELEELQALKQQLLLQQEEEHHANMMAQQKTYAQQSEQLQQIQQLQLQLQRQLDEHYGSTGITGNLLDAKYAGVGDSGQYWPVKDESTIPSVGTQFEESQDQFKPVHIHQADLDTGRKIIDSGVQTDDEDSAEKQHIGRKKKNKRNVDSSGQTDDEDQDEWDAPTKARRRSRKHSSDGKHGSKVSSIAIQTVAEISVQTDHSGTIKRPSVHMDTKVEIIKHISAPENSQKGGSLSCQTDSDRRHTPIEVGYSTHLTADVPSKTKVFYNTVSPLSPEKSLGGQRMLTADPTRFSSGPRILKAGQKSLSDPKSLSPTTEDRMSGYYRDSYSGRGSPSGTGKKVKRTLPDPPSEDDSLAGRSGYSSNSARRRLARSTTMARAKILQDIDKELDLVERESSKLRKKQAELDEEEKEIDAKLRYLEMGINRRKEALLKEREKRERAYLQGVAEERDYMSDSEVSNIREATGEGLERPRTAPQSEFDQFIPPQTEADSQYNTLTSPYSHYGQYVPQTQTTSHYTAQNLYQQQSLYHQQVSPYPTLSLSHAQDQPSSYQHALLLQQGKQRQTNLSDLEPKITTSYEVMHNQPLLIVPTSTESGYGVAHLGAKYGNFDLRLGLEERSMASSPMSSISGDSFYADIDHHNARNYVLIEDIGELTKSSTRLGNTGLGSGFNLHDKELSKADRLLRAAEVRRTTEVADFLGSSQLQSYTKGDDETMEEPYELKLLKQQIKQEFRRGTEGLEHLTGLGAPHYLPSDSSFRHFPKGEKYSIGRLTLEKQAAKQLPAAVLYQKQMKNKKALLDPKAITKFSPIQESRDLEPDFASYMESGASSVTNLAATARLLQDEITFGLRKNLSEQQKYLGSSLGGNLAGSLNLGQSIGLGSTIRPSAQDDGTYPSGTRSRPSSRPSSVYGLDLSIKRDLSSSSLRLKTEGDVLDAAFAPGVARVKPNSLPISQSRGRIPFVAQNSEEESPLSPVGQPMGMARASAGPLPPISADSRDQYGSSHSLPEVQQHMREESRTRGYDRDIAFIIDDLQGAMSDSEALSETMLAMNRDDARIFHESIRHAGGPNWNIEAYHLRREDTDWFDKPREGHPQSGNVSDRRGMKLVPYAFPHTHIKLKKDLKDTSVSGNGLGIRVVGGKEIPGRKGEIGAFVAKVIPGGVAEQTGKVVKGMQVLEWNGVPLTAKTYEEVQCIMGQPCAEAELCVRLDLNMLSDPEHPQALEHHVQLKAVGGQRSPGVDPNQLAAELQKVSQQQAPGVAGTGVGPGALGILSALERSALLHSGPGSAASSGVPSPGQPASPAISKKQRPKPIEVTKTPHPITGEIQLQINYDRNLGNLIVHVLQARNLAPRDNDSYSDPFVKVYLLPGRGADNKRRTRYAQKTMNPEWNQTVIYKNIHLEQLKKKTLEVTVWDYDRSSSNDFLGEVLIDLSNTAQLDNTPRWWPLREQSESIEHSRAHHAAQGPPGSGSGQGYMSVPGMGPGHGMGQGLAPGHGDDGSQDSPRNSVIKSRSHGIFPDPAKDMQMMPLEKSHSSPGSSKSSSDGQLRSHGPSRSQSKSSVTQAHLEDAGIAIAAAEAAVQQSRLQPRPGHRLGDVSGPVVLSAPSLVGDPYGGLDGEEGEGTGVDSAIFQVPRIGKTTLNGTDKNQLGTPENEGGKTQVMGEIKVALKKEVKTEGDQLVLEILQCRNITYKFKSPDHLPDLYVKLYVVNVATQKRIIKKKTRICRHDREPSFNETFRFPLNPTGHSIQLFLVSNGGKFMKKTLIGEAYIWLDKVDMRKRVVSWHKLFVSSTLTNP